MFSSSPWSIGSGARFSDATVFGGRAMWPLDSYREVLSEHARGHRLIASAWIVVAALMLLLVAFA
jgi:hypothetical protein